MSWSESGKNWFESTKKLNPFGMNWFESTKNMNLSERPKNWYEMAKNGFGRSKSWAEEKVKTKGISDEHRDLLIKGGEFLLLAPAIGYKDGLGSACRFIVSRAASDCEMAKNKLEKSKSWVEEEIRAKGIISDENRDLLIKGSEVLILAPVIGYYGGLASACGFIVRSSASEECCEMAKNRFEKTKGWVEMAKIGFEKSKNWAEERIRVTGISDEHRDLVVKGSGALLLAAAMGYYGGLGSVCGFMFRGVSSSDNGEKLMKAPGRPGEYIARAVFEANPRAYFRGSRGKSCL